MRLGLKSVFGRALQGVPILPLVSCKGYFAVFSPAKRPRPKQNPKGIGGGRGTRYAESELCQLATESQSPGHAYVQSNMRVKDTEHVNSRYSDPFRKLAKLRSSARLDMNADAANPLVLCCCRRKDRQLSVSCREHCNTARADFLSRLILRVVPSHDATVEGSPVSLFSKAIFYVHDTSHRRYRRYELVGVPRKRGPRAGVVASCNRVGGKESSPIFFHLLAAAVLCPHRKAAVKSPATRLRFCCSGVFFISYVPALL